jgi:hypothetical protein
MQGLKKEKCTNFERVANRAFPFFSLQNGVFINRKRRNECSATLEIAQKTSSQCNGFNCIHNLYLMNKEAMTNLHWLSQIKGRVNFAKNIAPFSLIN